jgi:hypothetical protein
MLQPRACNASERCDLLSSACLCYLSSDQLAALLRLQAILDLHGCIPLGLGFLLRGAAIVVSAEDPLQPLQLGLLEGVDWGHRGARGSQPASIQGDPASPVHDGIMLQLQGGGRVPLSRVSSAPLLSHSDLDIARMAAGLHWQESMGELGSDASSRWDERKRPPPGH